MCVSCICVLCVVVGSRVLLWLYCDVSCWSEMKCVCGCCSFSMISRWKTTLYVYSKRSLYVQLSRSLESSFLPFSVSCRLFLYTQLLLIVDVSIRRYSSIRWITKCSIHVVGICLDILVQASCHLQWSESVLPLKSAKSIMICLYWEFIRVGNWCVVMS